MNISLVYKKIAPNLTLGTAKIKIYLTYINFKKLYLSHQNLSQ